MKLCYDDDTARRGATPLPPFILPLPRSFSMPLQMFTFCKRGNFVELYGKGPLLFASWAVEAEFAELAGLQGCRVDKSLAVYYINYTYMCMYIVEGWR